MSDFTQYAQGTHPRAPISPKEAAELIGVSTRTLDRWRRDGNGPRYALHLGRVWYSRDGIDEFLESVHAPRESGGKDAA